jgi:hypothetical protein
MNATLWQATSAAVSVLNLVLRRPDVATVNCHCDFFSEKSPSGPISMVIFSLGFKTVLMFFYVSHNVRLVSPSCLSFKIF